MKMRYPLAAVAAAVLLSGCVIAIDPDDHKHVSSNEKVQTMAQMPLGTSTEQVIEQLGGPDKVEVFQRAAGEYRVLVYRHGDKNSLTPLVFLNGKLEGIGQMAVDQARAAAPSIETK